MKTSEIVKLLIVTFMVFHFGEFIFVEALYTSIGESPTLFQLDNLKVDIKQPHRTKMWNSGLSTA